MRFVQFFMLCTFYGFDHVDIYYMICFVDTLGWILRVVSWNGVLEWCLALGDILFLLLCIVSIYCATVPTTPSHLRIPLKVPTKSLNGYT